MGVLLVAYGKRNCGGRGNLCGAVGRVEILHADSLFLVGCLVAPSGIKAGGRDTYGEAGSGGLVAGGLEDEVLCGACGSQRVVIQGDGVRVL
ncbi:MAG: hypothetical protein LKE40_14425 [Spirochaetia bacterium]|nr:hypothetical protein [Spirochaetia bacterium]